MTRIVCEAQVDRYQNRDRGGKKKRIHSAETKKAANAFPPLSESDNLSELNQSLTLWPVEWMSLFVSGPQVNWLGNRKRSHAHPVTHTKENTKNNNNKKNRVKTTNDMSCVSTPRPFPGNQESLQDLWDQGLHLEIFQYFTRGHEPLWWGLFGGLEQNSL